MPNVPYPYKVNGKLVTGNGSLTPICSLSNSSLFPQFDCSIFEKWHSQQGGSPQTESYVILVYYAFFHFLVAIATHSAVVTEQNFDFCCFLGLCLVHVIFDVLKLSSNLESLFSFNFQLKKAAIKFCILGHLQAIKVP